ncbi:kinase-like protein [Acephala macrosclerotiorum]|nr:kinase-like protein [Acephala macrosclerotiorum]
MNAAWNRPTWNFDKISEIWDKMSQVSGGKCVLNPNVRLLAPGKTIGGSIRILKLINTANSSVYEAFDPSLQQPGNLQQSNCAIKARTKVNGDGSSVRCNLGKEVDIHYKVNKHLNIATLFKVFEYSTCSLMVLEYFPDGDLQTVIHQTLGDEAFVKDAFLQILEAVEFCHSQGVYHRDLKAANILVNGSRIALTDFGHATMNTTSKKGVGTKYAMSPECYTSRYCAEDGPIPYDTGSSDIWSLGIILAHLIAGLMPWEQPSKDDELYKGYRESGRFGQDSKFSDKAKGILAKVLCEDPTQRLSISLLRILINDCDRFGTDPSAAAPYFFGMGIDNAVRGESLDRMQID